MGRPALPRRGRPIRGPAIGVRRVRRAFSDVGGRIVLGTPKSHQSRTVPVPRFIAAGQAAATSGKHPDELVFTMPGTSVVRLSNWRRAVFPPARARAGTSDRLRVHDLRHTAASLMIQAGYPPKMLQEILGHASITTTLDLYGNSRVLHEAGEKPQVSRSLRCRNSVPCLRAAAV
jgi:integrase